MIDGRDPASAVRGLLIAVPIALALWAVIFAGVVTVYDLPLMPWSPR